MSQRRIDRCPACGEVIFATARCEIGPPVSLVIPCYLADVVLDAGGHIVSWKPGFDTLTESMDFHADGYEPAALEVYCDNGHDPVALLAEAAASPRQPRFTRARRASCDPARPLVTS